MDALQLLTNDHRTVDAVFERYLQTSTDASAERRALADRMISELSIHAAIEEQILYPGVKRALEDGAPLANEALDDHAEVKEVLAELDDMDAEDPAFDRKVRTLIEDVRHHVEEEEGEMFPKLRDALSAEDLEEMGRTMASAKKVAPTRPHPHAPDEPPGNVIAGLVAGVIDRGRDLLSGREPAPVPGGGRTGGQSQTSRSSKRAARSKRTAASKRTTESKRPAKTSDGKKRSSARAKGPVIHVTAEDGGGWRAASRGARAVARGDDKRDVVRRAREAARRRGGRLVIHGRDGTIQEERTYGDDPRRSKG